jgi:DNA-binding MarR family transcriptional regulator
VTTERPSARRLSRECALERYLELRPVIRAWLRASSVPPEVQAEFASVTSHQLRALVRMPDTGLCMRELAVAMNVTGATASALADRLVAQGLALREHDPGDRRVVRLVPSERGREMARRVRETQRRSAETLFGRLSDRQVAAFLDVLETLAAGDVADPARIERAS